MKYSSVLYFDFYRLQDQDFTPNNFVQLKKALMQYFRPSSFVRQHAGNKLEEHVLSSTVRGSQMESNLIKLYAIPLKKKDENPRAQHESYVSALWKLRDQVLSLYLSPPSISVYIHTHEHERILHKYYSTGFVEFLYFASCCCYISFFLVDPLLLK